jgi:hypothetical protein
MSRRKLYFIENITVFFLLIGTVVTRIHVRLLVCQPLNKHITSYPFLAGEVSALDAANYKNMI